MKILGWILIGVLCLNAISNIAAFARNDKKLGDILINIAFNTLTGLYILYTIVTSG